MCAHHRPNLMDARHFLTDKPRVAADHANGQACADDPGSGNEAASIAVCNVKMEWSREPTSRTVVKPTSSVWRAAWPDLSRLKARKFPWPIVIDDIGFSAEAEMHVTIDQTW